MKSISLKYAKERFKRNYGKYSLEENFIDAISSYNLDEDEIVELYKFVVKKLEEKEIRKLNNFLMTTILEGEAI